MKYLVYFIKQEKTNCVKIGVAHNAKKRMKELQTGSPYPLKIIALIDPGKACGEKVEKYLHKLFTDFRLIGEWFSYSEEIEKFAKKYKYRPSNPIKLQSDIEDLPELARRIYVLPVENDIKPQLTAEEAAQQKSWEDKMVSEGHATLRFGQLFWKCDDRQN